MATYHKATDILVSLSPNLSVVVVGSSLVGALWENRRAASTYQPPSRGFSVGYVAACSADRFPSYSSLIYTFHMRQKPPQVSALFYERNSFYLFTFPSPFSGATLQNGEQGDGNPASQTFGTAVTSQGNHVNSLQVCCPAPPLPESFPDVRQLKCTVLARLRSNTSQKQLYAYLLFTCQQEVEPQPRRVTLTPFLASDQKEHVVPAHAATHMSTHTRTHTLTRTPWLS